MGPCEFAADRQTVRGGDGVYNRGASGITVFLDGCLLSKFLKKWLPLFAEIKATISVHVIWMHFYFYGSSDETVPVSGFCGKEFGSL